MDPTKTFSELEKMITLHIIIYYNIISITIQNNNK